MHAFYVTAPNKRPDLRLIQAFLWGDDENVKSDGNALSPASRTWTELSLISRDREDAWFEISEHKVIPLTLKVHSESKQIAAQVAYLLAHHMKSKVATMPSGSYESPEILISELGQEFDLEEAFARFQNSPFINATLENPYPNLGENGPAFYNGYGLIWREKFGIWIMRLMKALYRGN